MNHLVITFLASFLIWFMFAGLFILWMFRGDIKSEHVLHALIASFIEYRTIPFVRFEVPLEQGTYQMGCLFGKANDY